MKPSSSEKSRRSKVSDLARSYRVTSESNLLVLKEYLQGLDCPRALTVWLMFSNNEHDQMVKLECDPLHFTSAEDFRAAYCATKLLSKADFLKLATNRREVALQKFFEFEDRCRATNSRFRNLSLDPKYKGPNVWLLNATTRKIAQILGEVEVLKVLDKANWGPGVTNSIKGVNATGVNKFQFETGITRDLYFHITPADGEKISVLHEYPLWRENLLKQGFPRFEVGNVIVTVPKDAKTERVICVEPGINLWFQQGIGRVMTERLRKSGVDLRYQSRNQELARLGLKLKLATVDFSSASDSIASRVVEELLPTTWFNWLNACRSRNGILADRVIRWEKFSSMGNAFTFPLETLIFYAAAIAVAEYSGIFNAPEVVSVYGDDVILPESCFELYSSFADFLGFKVSQEKSFYSGLFRESCGSHYFDGKDVKPIFFKKLLSTPFSVYRFANAIRILSHRSMNLMGCDDRLRKAFVLLTRLVPKSLRFRIPLGESPDLRQGDGGFVSNFDEATPSRARFGIQGYNVTHLTEIATKRSSEEIGMLLYRLRNASLQEEGNNFPLRGRTKIRVKRFLAHQWYDLGPWI